jgi:hypothetical protein
VVVVVVVVAVVEKGKNSWRHTVGEKLQLHSFPTSALDEGLLHAPAALPQERTPVRTE